MVELPHGRGPGASAVQLATEYAIELKRVTKERDEALARERRLREAGQELHDAVVHRPVDSELMRFALEGWRAALADPAPEED